jgi:hypothetical protein
MPISLYSVADTSWSETGILWLNAPGLDTTNVVSTGTLISTQTLSLVQGGTLTFDVTAFVASHLGQVVTLQLFDNTVQDNIETDFYSREAPSGQPTLTISF